MSLPRALHQCLPGASLTAQPADPGALTPLQLSPVLPAAVFGGGRCQRSSLLRDGSPAGGSARVASCAPGQVLWPLIRLPPAFWPSPYPGSLGSFLWAASKHLSFPTKPARGHRLLLQRTSASSSSSSAPGEAPPCSSSLRPRPAPRRQIISFSLPSFPTEF